MPNVRQEKTAQETTTSYVTLLKAQVVGFPRCSLVITNSHGTNALKFKILTSNEPQGKADSWAEEKSEAVLNAGGAERYTLTGAFCWVDVQIIDASAGNHAVGNAWLVATGIT